MFAHHIVFSLSSTPAVPVSFPASKPIQTRSSPSPRSTHTHLYNTPRTPRITLSGPETIGNHVKDLCRQLLDHLGDTGVLASIDFDSSLRVKHHQICCLFWTCVTSPHGLCTIPPEANHPLLLHLVSLLQVVINLDIGVCSVPWYIVCDPQFRTPECTVYRIVIFSSLFHLVESLP